MSQTHSYQVQAEQLRADAQRYYAARSSGRAIMALRKAILLYAAADEAPAGTETDREPGNPAGPLTRDRAATCHEFGEWLQETGQYAEAASVYQEAVDSYARLGPEAEEQAGVCARKVLACLHALRDRPQDRLYLLLTRYERRMRQLALVQGTEAAQGECAMEMARILARRERPEEAVVRYQDALQLYAITTDTPANLLAQAECHHRLGGLLSLQIHEYPAAVRHYRQAITLYAAHEPFLYDDQPSLALCRRTLREIEQLLEA